VRGNGPIKRMQELRKNAAIRSHFLATLRDARATALADAEGADAVIFAIESLGRFLFGQDKALEQTSPALVTWVTDVLKNERGCELEKRLMLLRYGRNQRMHKGFAARNLTADAVRVATTLEEALLVDWSKYTAEDLMTRGPLVAQPWWTFGMVRDAIIENAYSHLPIWRDGRWQAISERRVAMLTQRARREPKALDLRNVRIDQHPPDRAKFGVLLDHLLAGDSAVVASSTPAKDLDLDTGCVLVVRKSEGAVDELVGILTPSDIM
jgi:hypothetical protein